MKNQLTGIRKVINDALCLRSLNELSTLNVPVQSLTTWQEGPWCEALEFDVSPPYMVQLRYMLTLTIQRKQLYHPSAILSSHIESATLSLRYEQPSRLPMRQSPHHSLVADSSPTPAACPVYAHSSTGGATPASPT
jgi:hypothetical protein